MNRFTLIFITYSVDAADGHYNQTDELSFPGS